MRGLQTRHCTHTCVYLMLISCEVAALDNNKQITSVIYKHILHRNTNKKKNHTRARDELVACTYPPITLWLSKPSRVDWTGYATYSSRRKMSRYENTYTYKE